MQNTQITDRYGDTLTIEEDSGVLSANIQEAGVGEATVLLRPDQCVEAAKAFLGLAGQQIIEVEALKRASDLTFNESVLRVAAIHKRTVTFRYAKDKGDFIEARRLNPEKIVGEGDKLAVLGQDPDREDRGGVRRFRLDRIKGEVQFA